MLSLLNIFLGIASWLDGIFNPVFDDMLTSITDVSKFDGAINILSVSQFSEAFNVSEQLVKSFSTGVQGITTAIGVALTVTYFIISLMSLASRDNTTLEHYIKEFVKLVIAVTVVAESWPIMLNLLQIGNSAVNATKTISVSGDTAIIQKVIIGMKIGAQYSGLAGVMSSFLPWIISQIAVLACYVAVFMRAVDLAWRAALFPIGVANMFDGGPNSPGLKYAKSFLGAVLAGCVIVICVKILPSLLTVGFRTGAGYWPDTSHYTPGYDLLTQVANDGPNGLYVKNNITWGMITMVAVEIGVVGAMFGASSKIKEVFS